MSALDIEVRDIRFKISSRLWNRLMAENMDTLGDVVELAGYEWLRVPGFGRLALKELEDGPVKGKVTVKEMLKATPGLVDVLKAVRDQMAPKPVLQRLYSAADASKCALGS